MFPRFSGVGWLDSWSRPRRRLVRAKALSRGVPSQVSDLVAAGRPVAQVAADLGISDQTIYVWRS
ncbi:helix-turn-helix domain-containing protein [Nocardia abscessus]|uniref:helix-turn-helix domain-containing protein n=1 Tax=Nocardia abscessus TaxID=120957 RepID=UPI003CC7C9C5